MSIFPLARSRVTAGFESLQSPVPALAFRRLNECFATQHYRSHLRPTLPLLSRAVAGSIITPAALSFAPEVRWIEFWSPQKPPIFIVGVSIRKKTGESSQLAY